MYCVLLSVLLTYFPEGKGDDLTGGDWWLQIFFLVRLGGLCLYAASSLVVTRTHVIVRNPLRRTDIPLAHVTTAISGNDLRIRTDYRSFVAAGVEAANAQVVADDFGTQLTSRSSSTGRPRKRGSEVVMTTLQARPTASDGPIRCSGSSRRFTSSGRLFYW